MKSLVILSLLALAAPITCDVFFNLVDPGYLYSNPICPKFSVEDFKKCLAKFDDIQFELLQTRAKCCSLTRLKKCALDAIRCGDTTEQVLNEMIEWIIENFKDHSKCQDHHGNFVIVYCLPGNQISSILYYQGLCEDIGKLMKLHLIFTSS